MLNLPDKMYAFNEVFRLFPEKPECRRGDGSIQAVITILFLCFPCLFQLKIPNAEVSETYLFQVPGGIAR